MGKYNTIMILGANSYFKRVSFIKQEKRINKQLISRDILKLQDILKRKLI